MAKAPIDPEVGDLTELLDLKRKMTKIDDQIHDKAAAVAARKLERLHPTCTFLVKKTHEPGFAIEGYANPQCKGRPVVVAEVRPVSVTPPNNYLSSQQMDVVAEDLERLKNSGITGSMYLVVLSEDIKEDIRGEFDFDVEFAGISILSVF